MAQLYGLTLLNFQVQIISDLSILDTSKLSSSVFPVVLQEIWWENYIEMY